MKLWHKILLTSLGLFALAFHVASIYFLSSTHVSNLEQETARAFSDQAIIRERVEAGIIASGMPDDPGPLMQRYSDYYSSLDIELDLYQISSGRIFGALDPESVDPELLKPSSRSEMEPVQEEETANENFVQKAAVSKLEQDGAKRQYIHVSSQLNSDSDYLLIYTRDISDIYDRRAAMIRAFVMIDLISALILGLAAYVLARKMTKPLEKLGEAAVQIADGHYSRIVPESRDETADLTRAFNRMSEAVNQRERELEKLAEQRQLFIDNLTHEMNTPLTSIQGYASLLQQAKLSEEQRNNAAEVIEREARRLRELYDRLMTLILSRKTELHLEEIKLEKIFQELEQTMMPTLRDNGIILETKPNDCIIKADHSLLLLLLTNLVKNSIAASDAGSVITVGAESNEAEMTEVYVSDQGRGIEPEYIEQIFEPFYRVDKSRSRKTGGVGLGLALCREIASRHNGRLTVDSVLGEGTTMRLLIPAEKIQL